jgi:hypothetical protein
LCSCQITQGFEGLFGKLSVVLKSQSSRHHP